MGRIAKEPGGINLDAVRNISSFAHFDIYKWVVALAHGRVVFSIIGS